MISVLGTLDQVTRILILARDMVGYIHHFGMPNYDGGHSQPEEDCKHPDCVAAREVTIVSKQS